MPRHSGLFVEKTNAVCDCCYIILLCCVLLLFFLESKECALAIRYVISALLFPSKKPGCTARRWISAETIADWSDPGQLTLVSYPVYISSVPALSNIKLTAT